MTAINTHSMRQFPLQ